MAANLDDKLRKVGASTVTTLAAPGKAIGAETITVGATTNYPDDTGFIVAIRQVDTNGDLVAGTYTEWKAIKTSGTTLAINATPVLGSDQVYAAGSTTQVFIPASSFGHNEMVDAVLSQHKQTGAHGTVTADSISAPNATLTNATITNLTVGGQTPSPDWTSIATAPNTVTYNGNGSYSLVFNGVDYTNILSAGQRIKTTRTVAAPTQCTSLNGTNQYWVKTSPNKMTFPDDFVVDAYVKMTQYGAISSMVSRYNGTSGFELKAESTGQITLVGFNGGAGNYSQVTSSQSIPLNKWVRVTAQLDMSAFATTATTSYVMFDGVDVPATVSRGGTNPTALVQAGNLEIGSKNGGTTPFPGKLAQVAVFNAKVTQATMRDYHTHGYDGSETSLASAYSFNGVATDLMTTTPNDLTAQNSAGYVTDSPFGDYGTSSTLDYGIIMAKPTFSTNTTVVVQVPEGCTIPTTGGINAISYSGLKSPYGFPGQANRWEIECINFVGASQLSPVAGTSYNLGSFYLTVPVGAWQITNQTTSAADKSSATGLIVQQALSTLNNTTTDASMAVFCQVQGALGTMEATVQQTKNKYISLSTPTVYYNNISTSTASAYALYLRLGSRIYAVPSIL